MAFLRPIFSRWKVSSSTVLSASCEMPIMRYPRCPLSTHGLDCKCTMLLLRSSKTTILMNARFLGYRYLQGGRMSAGVSASFPMCLDDTDSHITLQYLPRYQLPLLCLSAEIDLVAFNRELDALENSQIPNSSQRIWHHFAKPSLVPHPKCPPLTFQSSILRVEKDYS